jgi:hypothetical protein
MRHFLRHEVGPARPVSSLSGRLQTPSTRFGPVSSASPTNRLSAALRRAARAEPLPSIASPAEAKLQPTAPAGNEPIDVQQHGAPRRRFVDMEHGMW